MKGDKTRCKQFRSMFLFIPEQISCSIMIAGRIQLLFHHSAKLLPVVLCQLTLNILGVERGHPSSRALLGSPPLPRHTWWWVCAHRPRGVRSAGVAFPPAPAVSPTHAGAAGGIPPHLPADVWPGTGLPERSCAG